MTQYNKIVLASLVFALASTGLAQEAAQAASNSSQEGLIAIGKGMAVGLAAIGTGIAQSRIGGGAVGAIAEDPSKFGTMLILLLIPETLVIFGLLAFFLM